MIHSKEPIRKKGALFTYTNNANKDLGGFCSFQKTELNGLADSLFIAEYLQYNKKKADLQLETIRNTDLYKKNLAIWQKKKFENDVATPDFEKIGKTFNFTIKIFDAIKTGSQEYNKNEPITILLLKTNKTHKPIVLFQTTGGAQALSNAVLKPPAVAPANKRLRNSKVIRNPPRPIKYESNKYEYYEGYKYEPLVVRTDYKSRRMVTTMIEEPRLVYYDEET